jgi:hypothetical protein
MRKSIRSLKKANTQIYSPFRRWTCGRIIKTFQNVLTKCEPVFNHKTFLTNTFLLVDFYMLVEYFIFYYTFLNWIDKITTLSNGYLGSRNDEERSEMRYVMRIAEFSESSNLWTQIALLGSPRSTPLSVSVQQSLSSV